MTIQEFMPNWTVICEAWERKPSKQLTDIYFRALKDLTREQWEIATQGIINNYPYATLPKPATIREQLGIGQDEDAQALLAMKKIEDAMRLEGAYQSVVFDDPIIHMLIQGNEGGWPGLCTLTTEEWMWKQKEWVKLYKVYSARPIECSPRLVGITEGQDIALLDFQRKQMVSYVGDKEKCVQIEAQKQIGR